MSREEVITIICGPTGVGKSAVALDLAETLDAEIVSADAGQVYCGFDIGTAKPSAEEKDRVRHHCIDLWGPDVRSDAVLWARAADAAIADIQKRGKRVLVVGGTGFYIRALLHGLFPGPDPEPELRNKLNQEFEEEGGAKMHERLQEIDPESARRIHPNDPVRLVRALEIYEMTGKSMSQWQKEHEFQEERYPYIKVGLNRDREELYGRINERVIQMMNAGWLDEARALYAKWGGEVPAFQLIGYRELAAYSAGERQEKDVIPNIQQASRHYAKRQLTWFRAEKNIKWVDLTALGRSGTQALQEIVHAQQNPFS